MIILKTSQDTIGEVVRHSKHALKMRPNVKQGELILISELKTKLPPHRKPIQYVMEFEECHEDRQQESLRIWGRHWRYVINGGNCRPLKTPFDISTVQVTNKDYGRGGAVVHVNDDDAQVLILMGLLE
jgi:5-methylcytosine-specific restriction enzyme A